LPFHGRSRQNLNLSAALQRSKFHKARRWGNIMRQRLPPISARRINMAESYEVAYWSKVFGVSEDDLVSTVSEVGEDVERVRRALAKDQKGRDGRLLA
jgi:hypothetical protein